MARLATRVLVLIAFSLSAQAVMVLRPKLNEVHLWNDENVLNHTFSLDNDIPAINITIEVFQDIMDVDFSVTVKVIEDGFPQYFISGTISQNMCFLLAHKELPLMLQVLQHLKDFAHIFESCPIEKGHYFIRDFWQDEREAPETAPKKPFVIDVDATALLPNGLRIPLIRDTIIGVAVHKNVDKPYSRADDTPSIE